MTDKKDFNEIVVPRLLTGGQVGVFATDTLYGVMGSALKKEVVDRIYSFRKKDSKKPLIILISKVGDLKLFSVKLTEKQKEKLKEIWPGPVSVVLDCMDEKFAYLHRGTRSLAFRIPADSDLRGMLAKTGPLVAPSANLPSEPPAQTIDQAKKYFQNKVDFYVDEGKRELQPSTIIRLEKNGEAEILRQGVAKV